MLHELNPEQRDAAAHIDGPLLILAGAGSGKTKTVVYRIAHFIEQGIPGNQILAVSFTNKAVREMQERVATMISNPTQANSLTLKTFHSLGVMLLRKDIQALDYPKKFTIFDPGDQLAVVRKVMRELAVDEKSIDPKELLAQISLAKNQLEEPQDVEFPLVRAVYQEYQNNLRVYGAVDFDDLIFLPVLLLKRNQHLRDYWSRRFQYIMIDEYQDTNFAQLNLVRLLASSHSNLCVVGDDDQSIYGWRGSNVENIRNFHQQFQNTKVVTLTQNYRCSGNILRAANKVINQGKGRFAKELWTEKEEGPKIGFLELEDETQEAQKVVDHLHDTHFSDNLKWSDFAILYRTNTQARVFEEMLRLNRIPYQIIGGQKFYDRKEIRDLLAYLRVLYQPEDEIALRRIINYPNRGIGTATIQKISNYAKEHGLSFYQTCTYADVLPLNPPAKKALVDFMKFIREFRARVQEQLMSDWIPTMIQETHLKQSIYKEYPKLSEAAKRLEFIDTFEESIQQYEKKAFAPSLENFLERICLDHSNDEETEKNSENSVTLMTLHSAKGLEFPVVYLVGLEEGLLPFFRSEEERCDVEEERRLCYVGITRAKSRLILSRALFRNKFGQKVERQPSRFLEDIPASLLHWLEKDSTPASLDSQKAKDSKFQDFFATVFSLKKPEHMKETKK